MLLSFLETTKAIQLQLAKSSKDAQKIKKALVEAHELVLRVKKSGQGSSG